MTEYSMCRYCAKVSLNADEMKAHFFRAHKNKDTCSINKKVRKIKTEEKGEEGKEEEGEKEEEEVEK